MEEMEVPTEKLHETIEEQVENAVEKNEKKGIMAIAISTALDRNGPSVFSACHASRSNGSRPTAWRRMTSSAVPSKDWLIQSTGVSPQPTWPASVSNRTSTASFVEPAR